MMIRSSHVGREVKREESFTALVTEHAEALGKYCRFLTGSVLQGQDLMQETWLKCWAAFGEDGRALNRTYLRSVAYHAWIDRIRKERNETSWSEQDPVEFMDEVDPLQLWAAVELLIDVLTPDQRTVYLLMEHMRFTAIETATMLGTTEGGVKASLHRARRKLDQYRQREHHADDRSHEADEQKVFAYIRAIQLQDVRALMVLWNEGSGEEAALTVRCAAPACKPVLLSEYMPASSLSSLRARSPLRLQLVA